MWMRSQFILRRTRAFKPPTFAPRALLSSTRVPHYPRKESTVKSSTPRLSKRSSSSVPPAAPPQDPDVPDESPEVTVEVSNGESPPDPAEEEGEKIKRRTRSTASTSGSATKESESSASLPAGLNILWTPDSHLHTDESTSATNLHASSALPPPEIFHEVLTNLHITLHPQTQHRAAYASPSGPPIEPTLALYCPIEGGDYIIDETVRELGRQAGAEVVVLDSVQLAAGECGQFGKGASCHIRYVQRVGLTGVQLRQLFVCPTILCILRVLHPLLPDNRILPSKMMMTMIWVRVICLHLKLHYMSWHQHRRALVVS